MSRIPRPGTPAPQPVSLVPGERPRFLSEADCHDIANRLARYAKGGGETDVHIVSRWRGNVRWARNRITTTGEDRDNHVMIRRIIRGAQSWDAIQINDVSDAALVAATRRAERLIETTKETVDADLTTRPDSPFRWHDEPVAVGPLFFDATYQLDARQRAGAARQLMQGAAAAGMLSAGYIEVTATSFAYITSWGYARYCQYTWAQYSNTVRDPKGAGSGWAGVDWPDWSRVNGEQLSAVALEKCLKSRNPVAIEPGHYTTILEPQAVCDFLKSWPEAAFGRKGAETFKSNPFTATPAPEPIGRARFGEQVIDKRLTIRTDPVDPDISYPPFRKDMTWLADVRVYHPATWIERGILKQLGETRDFSIQWLGRDTGIPASGSFRMSVDGPTSTIDEMIAATKRGLLVTRFDQVDPDYRTAALMCRGYTRDGLWLIEDGKISKPVRNLMFYESTMAALNKVEQVGVPQRCFNPVPGGREEWELDPQPIIAPALKIQDFTFTALSNAI